MRPASPVIEKFGSRSSSSPGGPTPMSPASTGSVGARHAPRAIAAPSDSPMTSEPNSAIAPIVSGIATSSRRATLRQPRNVSSRSSFRPVANRATTTASSVACSKNVLSANGSSQRMPMKWMPAAAMSPNPR